MDKLVSTGSIPDYYFLGFILFCFVLFCIMLVVGRRMWRRSRHHDSEFRMKIMKIMSLVLVGGVGPQRKRRRARRAGADELGSDF